MIGVAVSPGRAAGPVAVMPPPVPEPAMDSGLAGEQPEVAVRRIRAAAEQVRADLQGAADHAAGDAQELLATTAMMAADPDLLSRAEGYVAGGTGPARAVWQAADDVIAELSALGGYLAERGRDVADARDRVVAALTGRPAPGVPDLPHPVVLVAEDLAPADAALLDPGRVRALVTARGGPTSHTAILVRSLGIPAVLGVPDATGLAEGTVVLVDGGAGTVVVDPPAELVERAEQLARTVPAFDGTGRTADGHRVPLLANVGSVADARAAAAAGAEGVGLFRTEVCFLDRTEPPPVEEQVTTYRQVLELFPGRRVVVRTLDSGADKPLAFLRARHEPNPALGVRGLRAAVDDPQVLDDQLTAIAAAVDGTGADVWVMAPMVSTVTEAEDFARRCRDHGLTTPGVMIEVPAAALRAGPILARTAFASLGTNDLTQYAMAADRLLDAVAALGTPWQPAVLDLVAAACRGGAQQDRPVGVCGEAAGDPALAPVLVGLGVSSLSMSPSALPQVAAVLASVTQAECQALAAAALAAETAEDARGVVRSRLPVLEALGL